LILPGGIDPHVHVSLPDYVPEEYRWADDFESGSMAALAGGITTLGVISVPGIGETPMGTLKRETNVAQQQTIADIMIHPVLQSPTEKNLRDFPKLIEKGCTSIKIFMITEEFDKYIVGYLRALEMAKELGIITLVHCEDYGIITTICKTMIEQGRGSLKNYAESRPIVSEVVATQRAVAMSEVSGAPIYVVHLSSKRALKVCEEAQSRGLPVYVEGRPIFLYFTKEKYLEQEGALYVVQPPLREKNDIKALWEGLRNGTIHTIATDHAPHTREQKLKPTLNVINLVPGINELQVMLPMFYSRGVVERKFSLQQFVSLTSSNPAKLFGLYPQKGTIQVGSDADLVLWDPTETRTIKNAEMFSNAGFTIYDGMKLRGWPQMTIRRGEIVYEDRTITSQPGSGQIVQRGHPKALSIS
jgi:dihydropyrimidinase